MSFASESMYHRQTTRHNADRHSSDAVAQAQLRGLIGDYQDSDEDALAKGLEAFETINRVVDEHEEATSPRAPQETPPQVSVARPAAASVHRRSMGQACTSEHCHDPKTCST